MGLYLYYGLSLASALLGYLFAKNKISKDLFTTSITLSSLTLGGIILKLGLPNMSDFWTFASIISVVAISSLAGARLGIKSIKKNKR